MLIQYIKLFFLYVLMHSPLSEYTTNDFSNSAALPYLDFNNPQCKNWMIYYTKMLYIVVFVTGVTNKSGNSSM